MLFQGNTFDTTRDHGYRHLVANESASVTLDGNTFRNINQSSSTPAIAIHLQSGNLKSLTLTNNVHENPASYPLTYFIEENVNVPSGGQVISGNVSAVSSRINRAVVPTR